MKKAFAVLNVLMFAAMAFGISRYDAVRGLELKAMVSGTFVLFGAVNALYALLARVPKRYPLAIWAGLILSMLGDVTLGFSMYLGAGLFALGHGMYVIAFGGLERPCRRDILISAAIFAGAAAFLLLYPAFRFDGAAMKGVSMAYALVISCMTGKAVSNFAGERSGLHALIMAAALLFFFSDLMLALVFFAGGSRIADTLCLYTYYPAQALLAHSIYHFANRQ